MTVGHACDTGAGIETGRVGSGPTESSARSCARVAGGVGPPCEVSCPDRTDVAGTASLQRRSVRSRRRSSRWAGLSLSCDRSRAWRLKEAWQPKEQSGRHGETRSHTLATQLHLLARRPHGQYRWSAKRSHRDVSQRTDDASANAGAENVRGRECDGHGVRWRVGVAHVRATER